MEEDGQERRNNLKILNKYEDQPERLVITRSQPEELLATRAHVTYVWKV